MLYILQENYVLDIKASTHQKLKLKKNPQMDLNPSPLDKTYMLYQLSQSGIVEVDDPNMIFKSESIGNCFII